MSEAEGWAFCVECNHETIHLFSGSCRKGICMECGHELPPDERPLRIVSYNG